MVLRTFHKALDAEVTDAQVLPGRAAGAFPITSLTLSLDDAGFANVVKALIVPTRSRS